MILYNYDSEGYELEVTQAKLDPLESELQGSEVYLIPKNATTVSKGPNRFNRIQKFDGQAWQYILDLKGTEYYIGAEKYTIEDYGQALPSGASTTPPVEATNPALVAKALLQDSLGNITYESSSGNIQSRLQDKANLEEKIKMLQAQENTRWILADNTIGMVSKEDLENALAFGIQETDRLYNEFFNTVEVL